MDGTKKPSLGVRKNKRKNQRLLKNIEDYLKSDCYMFTPLISAPQPPSGSGSQKPCSASVAGFGMAEFNRSNKKRRLLEKVGEFLKSDYHMYGFMVSPEKLGPPLKGQLRYKRRVTMEVSTDAIATEDCRPSPRSKTVVTKDRYSKRSHTEMSVEASGWDEAMKQMFHQHPCSFTSHSVGKSNRR